MKYLILMSGLLLAYFTVSAQKNHPEWSVHNISPNLKIGAEEIIRLSEEIFEVKSLSEGHISSRSVVSILNEDSDANELVIYYDTDTKIKNIQVRLFDAQGNFVRNIKKSEIKDYSAVNGFSLYEDNRVYVVEVSHDEYPYTIEWEYQQNLKGISFALYPDWHIQSYRQGVESASYQVILPQGQELNIKTKNIDLEPVIEEKGKKFYTWSVKNLKPIIPEAYQPTSFAILPKVMISAADFKIKEYRGSMESWEAFGGFMYQLFEGKDQLPVEVVNEVKALVKDVYSDQDKIDRIYRYMQSKVRYVSVQLGIGGWQPFDANYVASNSYGDCKALSNYMKALLKVVGIEAHPALIYSGNIDYQIEDDFIYPRFNHVVLHVPQEDYWLECTSTSYPPNYLGSSNWNRRVLLITEEGGVVTRTPSPKAEQNLEVIKAKVVVNEEGWADVNYESTFKGSLHERIRRYTDNYDEEEKKKWLLNTTSLSNLELSSLEMSYEKNRPEATLNYSGNVRRYASKSGKRFFVSINDVSVHGGAPDKMEERKFPIVTNRNFKEVLDIELQFPENYQIEAMPYPSDELESEFAKYSIQIEERGGKVYLHREIEFKPATLPATDYKAFRKFYRDISKREKAKLVLVEKKT
ncbi:MAG: DUF3857 domain-containing protein [Bacteroidota bacterium]